MVGPGDPIFSPAVHVSRSWLSKWYILGLGELPVERVTVLFQRDVTSLGPSYLARCITRIEPSKGNVDYVGRYLDFVQLF